MHYSEYNKNIEWAVVQNGDTKGAELVALHHLYHTHEGEDWMDRVIEGRWTAEEVAIQILTEITEGHNIPNDDAMVEAFAAQIQEEVEEHIRAL